LSVDGFVFITKTPRRVSAHRNGFPCSARLPPWSGISIARIRLASCVTPSVQSVASRGRNLDLLSIDYAFRSRLMSRLTLGGLAFPRNPGAYGECVSHTLCATHADILTSLRSTEPRGSTSPPRERSPTDERHNRPSRGFGDMLSRRSGLFPSRPRNFSPAVSLPRFDRSGIRSLVEFGRTPVPRVHPELYPRLSFYAAAAKCIPGRPSYYRTRLAFHS